ncbi:MBL fold metallo-hydrolase [Thermococcus argininiproducens]|uniref:MBL fold metallo-hydrolase n=1 Tax=Thermococcus argininiproducens TaxID=2866384 RepID=A0A9E7MB77_9EURY|nr:MBL fold metallo-hydrolase [Thermococcus argininiproducens]USH00037.1 MBL fold metallo-hydrolase [Thermococcus argininiproducens]
MKVIGDIHLVDNTFANVYLIVRDNKLIIIDTGLPEEYEKIIKYIDSLGRIPEEVEIIIATHAHYDHIGALKVLKEATGAKVAAHKEEIPYINGEKVFKKGYTPVSEPVDVEISLEDGDEIKGLKVIHSPGHTPGSICLLDLETKALFVGDLVVEQKGELYEVPHHYSIDPMKNREAIKELLEIDFNHLLPSHGNPVLNEGKEKLRELVERFLKSD